MSGNSLSNSRDSLRKNLTSHYRKEDIVKNKIENRERIFRNKNQKRVLPSLTSKENEYADDFDDNNHENMFPTQPGKKQRGGSVAKNVK